MRDDDGSIWQGLLVSMLCFGCLVFGYVLRDRGLVIRVDREQNYYQERLR
jgi:hypothetical protein